MASLMNLSISSRLGILIAIPVVSLVLLLSATFMVISHINANVNSLYEDRIVPLRGLKLIADDYAVSVIDAVNKTNAGIMRPREALDGIHHVEQEIAKEWKAYLATKASDEERKLAMEADALFHPANQAISQLKTKLTLLGEDGRGQLDEFDGPLYTTIDPISGKISELIDLQLSEAKAQHNLISATFSSAQSTLTIASLVIIITLIVLGGVIVASIKRPLLALQQTINHVVSNHDLTVKVPVEGRNEISQTASRFNSMMDTLRGLIGAITHSATQVNSAAEQLSSTNAQTHAALHTQTSEIDQVATAINEMVATVHEVARSASLAANAAQNSDQQAKDGHRAVGDVIIEMRTLNQEVENAATAIHSLDADVGEIGTVLDVIRNIADQTNLLALNAAIEAARAGEQGRGFAVVADEVRTLASRTQASTLEIQAMIQRLQSSAKQAVRAMEQGQQKTTATVLKAEQAGEVLNRIISSITTIRDMNAQIATASEEQAAVSDEINRSVHNISHAAEETSSATELTAQTSNELARMATDLHRQVDRFKAA